MHEAGRLLIKTQSDGAVDLASFEAGNADIHTLWCTRNNGTYALDVWIPTALVADMRMRD